MNSDNDPNADGNKISNRIDRFMRENDVISLDYAGMAQHFKDIGLLEKPGYTWGHRPWNTSASSMMATSCRRPTTPMNS